MKAYTAAPPDVLRVDEKNLREHAVLNCAASSSPPTTRPTASTCRPTTAATSSRGPTSRKDDFAEDYWNRSVALVRRRRRSPRRRLPRTALDISAFDPKAPPPKTAAFWEIVDANRAPEDGELRDVLDRLGNPDAVTLLNVADRAEGDFAIWLRDRKNRRIRHRFEKCGYVAVRNKAPRTAYGRSAIGGRSSMPTRA